MNLLDSSVTLDVMCAHCGAVIGEATPEDILLTGGHNIAAAHAAVCPMAVGVEES